MTRTRRSPLALAALFGPPIALMAVIFTLSAQPDLSSGLGLIDLILRKLVHMAEYALLLLLWWRAFREYAAPRTAVAAAGAVTLLYAISDEWHQTFVEGRNGTPVDVGIDAVGMAVAAALILRRSG